MTIRISFFLLLLCAFALGAAAQKAPPEIKRPKLPAGADTNDAQAYFHFGLASRTSAKDAYAAFHWARRIDPTEPLYAYAQFQAAWMRQSPEWRGHYFNGAKFVVESKEAALLDSLWYESLQRDPYAHFRGCTLYEWASDLEPATEGLVLYDGQCYRQAADRLAVALRERPKNISLRIPRARSLYAVGDYAGAVQELQRVIALLDERDEKRLRRVYESKAMYQYMVGLAYQKAHQYDQAREAFGRALMEDLSFHMAHQKLARLALEENDVGTAVNELALAVQLKPTDPAHRFEYGYALLQSLPPRPAEAEAQFREAIRLAPRFALPYFNLAAALEMRGSASEAAEQYRAYLARAPIAEKRTTTIARARLDSLAPR